MIAFDDIVADFDRWCGQFAPTPDCTATAAVYVDDAVQEYLARHTDARPHRAALLARIRARGQFTVPLDKRRWDAARRSRH